MPEGEFESVSADIKINGFSVKASCLLPLPSSCQKIFIKSFNLHDRALSLIQSVEICLLDNLRSNVVKQRLYYAISGPFQVARVS